MEDIDRELRRWLEAGLIDEAAASRIRAFEAAHGTRKPAAFEADRPGLAEALIYLGCAVVAVGAFVLVASNWGDLTAGGRGLVTLVPGLAAIVLGVLLRRMGNPGLARGGALALLLGAALVTGCAGVIAAEADWDAEEAVVLVAATATPLALVLWLFARTVPQLVGLAAAAVIVAIVPEVYFDDIDDILAFGLALAALATIWLAAVEFHLLMPREFAQSLGAAGLALGAYLAGVESAAGWQVLVFIAAAALIGLSLTRGTLIYLVPGIGAVFIGLVTLILRHVDDPTVAALALIGLGVVLVGVVLVMAQLRPWRWRRHSRV